MQSLYDGDARGVTGRFMKYRCLWPFRRAARKADLAGCEQRLRKEFLADPSILDTARTMTFALDDDVDSFLRGFIKRETPERIAPE